MRELDRDWSTDPEPRQANHDARTLETRRRDQWAEAGRPALVTPAEPIGWQDLCKPRTECAASY